MNILASEGLDMVWNHEKTFSVKFPINRAYLRGASKKYFFAIAL